MPKIWKRNCDQCSEYYESSAKRFCSLECRNENRIGFKHSEETKFKIGLGNTGKTVSLKSRKKMRRSKKKQFENGYKVWCDGLTALKDKRLKKSVEKRRLTVIANKTYRGKNNPAWKGGVANWKYSYNWKRISRALKELKGHRCEVCRTKTSGKKLDVHHKNFNKKDNEIKNLIILCRKCHRKVHPLT